MYYQTSIVRCPPSYQQCDTDQLSCIIIGCPHCPCIIALWEVSWMGCWTNPASVLIPMHCIGCGSINYPSWALLWKVDLKRTVQGKSDEGGLPEVSDQVSQILFFLFFTLYCPSHLSQRQYKYKCKCKTNFRLPTPNTNTNAKQIPGSQRQYKYKYRDKKNSGSQRQRQKAFAGPRHLPSPPTGWNIWHYQNIALHLLGGKRQLHTDI